MTLKFIDARIVLQADLPNDIKENINLFKEAVKAAWEFYSKVYGEPRRVWVNPKDAPEGVEDVEGIKIERRGGCVRGKLMVM